LEIDRENNNVLARCLTSDANVVKGDREDNNIVGCERSWKLREKKTT
jgi:hypothetical protein